MRQAPRDRPWPVLPGHCPTRRSAGTRRAPVLHERPPTPSACVIVFRDAVLLGGGLLVLPGCFFLWCWALPAAPHSFFLVFVASVISAKDMQCSHTGSTPADVADALAGSPAHSRGSWVVCSHPGGGAVGFASCKSDRAFRPRGARGDGTHEPQLCRCQAARLPNPAGVDTSGLVGPACRACGVGATPVTRPAVRTEVTGVPGAVDVAPVLPVGTVAVAPSTRPIRAGLVVRVALPEPAAGWRPAPAAGVRSCRRQSSAERCPRRALCVACRCRGCGRREWLMRLCRAGEGSGSSSPERESGDCGCGGDAVACLQGSPSLPWCGGARPAPLASPRVQAAVRVAERLSGFGVIAGRPSLWSAEILVEVTFRWDVPDLHQPGDEQAVGPVVTPTRASWRARCSRTRQPYVLKCGSTGRAAPELPRRCCRGRLAARHSLWRYAVEGLGLTVAVLALSAGERGS